MYDWETIRAEYIAGSASYKDLSEKYGVSYRQITQRGRDEDWAGGREKRRKKIANRAIDIAAKESAERQARSMSNLMAAADKLSARLIGDMDAIANSRDVSDVAKARKYAADTLAQVYGIQTPAQLHRQRMDEEKLKIERERFELEKKRQDAAGNAEPVRLMIVQPEEVEGDA